MTEVVENPKLLKHFPEQLLEDQKYVLCQYEKLEKIGEGTFG